MYLRTLTLIGVVVVLSVSVAAMAEGDESAATLFGQLGSSNQKMQDAARAKLMKLKPDVVLPAALKALSDESAAVRAGAAEMAARVVGPGDLQAATALVKALDDASPRVVAHAADALGAIGPKAARGAWSKLSKLTMNPDAGVRAAAAAAMDRVRPGSAVKLLIGRLRRGDAAAVKQVQGCLEAIADDFHACRSLHASRKILPKNLRSALLRRANDTLMAGPAKAAIRKTLSRKTGAINLDVIDLGDALKFLGEKSGVNVVVNWGMLEMSGITPETTVLYKSPAGARTYEQVLKGVLDQAVGDGAQFAVIAGAVVISTPDDLEALGEDRLKYTTRPIPTLADDLKIYHGLQRSMGTTRFDTIAMSDVLLYIRETTGMPMHVDWKALESMGVTRKTEAGLSAKGLTVDECLWHLLSQAVFAGELTHKIQYGVISISRTDHFPQEVGVATDEERLEEYLDIEDDEPGKKEDDKPADDGFMTDD